MRPPSGFSVLEALEPRLAPAGVVAVTVNNGMLTLTGDDAGNYAHITDLGNGAWRIQSGSEDPDDVTSFRLNGAEATPEVIVIGITGISCDLKGGSDGLRLQGLEIAGNVTIKNVTGGQAAFFNDSTVGGVTQVSGLVVHVEASGSVFNGALNIKGGRYDDGVYLNAGTYRSVSADLGDGYNSFNLVDDAEGASIRVLGDVTVKAKGSMYITNYVSFGADSLFIGGNVKVTLAGGGSLLDINHIKESNTLEIAGGFNLQTGHGTATLSLFESIKIGGKLDVKFGNGSSTIAGAGLESLAAGSFSYSGGTGGNSLSLASQDLEIKGDVSLRMGSSGSNSFNLSASDWGSIGGKLTYQGGKDADRITLGGNLRIGGLLDVKAGNGANELNSAEDLTRLSLGGFNYVGGTGSDNVYLSYGDLAIYGDVSIKAGAGPASHDIFNDLALGYEGNLEIYGNLTCQISGGVGMLSLLGDSVRVLGQVDFTGGKTSSELRISGQDVVIGSIFYKGGAGDDSITMGRTAAGDQNITVLGDVIANMGARGSYADFRDVTVLGSVSIASATDVSMDGSGGDSFSFLDSVFVGGLSVKSTGIGDTEVRLHNSVFHGAVVLDTGRGNDTVVLDTLTSFPGDLAVKNTFHGPVRILLGAGDDTLTAALVPGREDCGNVFLSSFFADGGAGTNTAAHMLSPNNEYAVIPVLKKFAA